MSMSPAKLEGEVVIFTVKRWHAGPTQQLKRGRLRVASGFIYRVGHGLQGESDYC